MNGLAVAFDPFDHFKQAVHVAGPVGDAGHPQNGRLPEVLVVHLGDGNVELVVPRAMMDLMTRRLPFSDPLPGIWSSMVQVAMTM